MKTLGAFLITLAIGMVSCSSKETIKAETMVEPTPVPVVASTDTTKAANLGAVSSGRAR